MMSDIPSSAYLSAEINVWPKPSNIFVRGKKCRLVNHEVNCSLHYLATSRCRLQTSAQHSYRDGTEVFFSVVKNEYFDKLSCTTRRLVLRNLARQRMHDVQINLRSQASDDELFICARVI
jgi:hypothetical protein